MATDARKPGFYIRVGRPGDPRGKSISGPHATYDEAEETAGRFYRGKCDGKPQWASVEQVE